MQKQKIIIIGNGMVGHRFCEKIIALDQKKKFSVQVFGEEPIQAYDRVHLTSYFETKKPDSLFLEKKDWYENHNIELLLNKKIVSLDSQTKRIKDADQKEYSYDKLILATGSAPFVPPIPGIDKQGVFEYRTIADLEQIIEYAKSARSAAVIGGGLLGLEAAKACLDLKLQTHVVEFAPRLMPRQLDEAGAALLAKKMQDLDIQIHVSTATESILGDDRVTGMAFTSKGEIEVDMVIVSAGIRPRDELAKDANIKTGERGGIVVDDFMKTSNPDVYAIGEVSLHENMIYGLVAPGYDMADVAARNLLGEKKLFKGADMSTKLKLIGVDVASFGDAFAETPGAREISINNEYTGIYKKLVINKDGTNLLGGILVGDAEDYGKFIQLVDNKITLPGEPESLIASSSSSSFEFELGDDAIICKCNDINKGDLLKAINEKNCMDMASLKSCSNSGTGCGGCLPQMNDILIKELKKQGKTVSLDLCEHFKFSRKELYNTIKIKKLKTFESVLSHCGKGTGCEVCKPTIASILSSLWNEQVSRDNLHAIQDTNDRFMANIQKGGTYSVVPRIPGGEITPDQLIRIGEVAKKFKLYTKITGGQRIDLFGARVEQLPDIWEQLIEVGLETGQAYGKSLRTVKSCVGSTWCRYGVQDSTTMAILLEKRYRGLRSPHKFKSAVSGCIRECAEAQSKDFGVIATEKGWNLYLAGNGGARPQHAELFESDLDDQTLVKYIDRFLMYYIQTADKLERTAWWFNKLDGGMDHLRSVIIDDSLGICSELDNMMQQHVDTYKCEWTEVVQNPEKRMRFRHFANTDEGDEDVNFELLRNQRVPVTAWEDVK